jgi:hypothetical protein
LRVGRAAVLVAERAVTAVELREEATVATAGPGPVAAAAGGGGGIRGRTLGARRRFPPLRPNANLAHCRSGPSRLAHADLLRGADFCASASHESRVAPRPGQSSNKPCSHLHFSA